MLLSLIAFGLNVLMTDFKKLTTQPLSSLDGPDGKHELTIINTFTPKARAITIHWITVYLPNNFFTPSL